MNSRDTLETKLGRVRGLPAGAAGSYRKAPYVFLANILPTLQMAVQEQVESPEAGRAGLDESLDRDPEGRS